MNPGNQVYCPLPLVSGAANMKTFLALFALAFATSTFAQSTPTPQAAAPGCGTDNIKFEVKSDKSQHPLLKPEPGKALIYFLQDDSYFENRPRPTSRFGLDGKWIGATQANSYFYFSVDPGEHHLCANWQNFLGVNVAVKSAATHFNAEQGGSYFFVVSDFYVQHQGPAFMKISQLDNDQAQLLMNRFAFSASHAKK